jgi:hypothetical protein
MSSQKSSQGRVGNKKPTQKNAPQKNSKIRHKLSFIYKKIVKYAVRNKIDTQLRAALEELMHTLGEIG